MSDEESSRKWINAHTYRIYSLLNVIVKRNVHDNQQYEAILTVHRCTAMCFSCTVCVCLCSCHQCRGMVDCGDKTAVVTLGETLKGTRSGKRSLSMCVPLRVYVCKNRTELLFCLCASPSVKEFILLSVSLIHILHYTHHHRTIWKLQALYRDQKALTFWLDILG